MESYGYAQFLWPLYEWELVHSGTGTRLTPPISVAHAVLAEFRLAGDAPQSPRMWAPMNEAPLLYREAVDLDIGDGQAILDWVNRRGNLWLPRLDRRNERTAEPHVRLYAAQTELETLREAVRIHRALHGHGPLPEVDLGKRLVGILRASEPGAEWARKAGKNEKDRKRLLAQAALYDALAFRVEDALIVSLSIFTDRMRPKLIRCTLSDFPVVRVSLMPTSLASCLWWQFLLAILSGREPRLCPGCGQWFVPRRRKHQTTCSTKCYMRVYRQ